MLQKIRTTSEKKPLAVCFCRVLKYCFRFFFSSIGVWTVYSCSLGDHVLATFHHMIESRLMIFVTNLK